MFPNVKIMSFLFFVGFVCMFLQNAQIGVSTKFGHCFLIWGAKSLVNKLSTPGSLSGPHFGSNV